MGRYDSSTCKGCGRDLPKTFLGHPYLGFDYYGKPHPRDGFYCGTCFTKIKKAAKGPTPEERAAEVLEEMSQRMRKMGVVTTAHYDAGRELITQAIKDAVERALKHGAH